MTRSLLPAILWLAAAPQPLAALPRPAQGQPPAAAAIEVEEKLGTRLPGDLTFTDERGRSVRLASYLGQGRPILLTLAYYRCPMLCDLVLRGLGQSLSRVDWLPGREYQAITVSIDPGDTRASARAKQAQVLQTVGHASAATGWPFLVGEEPAIHRLADSVGFRYAYDPRSEQFAHPAVAVVIAPDGRIARYLYGVSFRPLDVRLALAEAGEGRIGGFTARVLLSCFRYDPSTRRYGFVMAAVLKGGSGLVLLTLGAALVVLWRRDRARQRDG